MLIISKYKDFYDGIAGTMGIDKTIVYNRNEDIIYDIPGDFKYSWGSKKQKFPSLSYYCNILKGTQYKSYSFFMVGFCGKLYVGMKLFYDKEQNKFDITYDIDNLIKGFPKIKDDLNFIKNYDSIHVFREHNVPVFVYDKNYNNIEKSTHRKMVFILNPNLKDYQFYKIMDAFTTFQEISMFIGGVLGVGENIIQEIDEKFRITQYGFDKWSFRKEPQIKK